MQNRQIDLSLVNHVVMTRTNVRSDETTGLNMNRWYPGNLEIYTVYILQYH